MSGMIRCVRCGRAAARMKTLVERDVDGNILEAHEPALCALHFRVELAIQEGLAPDPFTSDPELAMWRRVTAQYVARISGLLGLPRY